MHEKHHCRDHTRGRGDETGHGTLTDSGESRLVTDIVHGDAFSGIKRGSVRVETGSVS